MSLFDNIYEIYRSQSVFRKYKPVLDAALKWGERYRFNSFHKLQSASNRLQGKIRDNPSRIGDFLPEALAVFAEMANLSFGFTLNKTQLFAAILLWEGKIVELKTGEGKTLVAALTAYIQSLTGKGIHIITTNDYLARRDREWMGTVFNRLEIPCGLVIQSTDRSLRKAEYKKPITYVANQEVAFDYLRDNMVMRPEDKVLSGFPFAVIDEVDSILIDEARTPFIISRKATLGKLGPLTEIFRVIDNLVFNEDYEIDLRYRAVNLTDAGTEKVIRLLGRDIFAETDLDVLRQLWFALYAKVFLQKDKDFIVKNGRVILVDEFTGHEMPDRRLLEGLEQIIEAKCGVPLEEETAIAASITYGSFFKMYEKVAGMSGTVVAAREEFAKLYGLEALEIAPPHKLQRQDLPTLFFRRETEKFNFAISEIKRLHGEGIPILAVGRSVAQVKRVSELLDKENVGHQLLHAEVTEKEAFIVENAGKRGAVTVATNMAGRGTDIILEKEIKEKSGLVVFGLEPNLSRRVDDQLRGRSGRQGGPGRTRFFASLEDEVFQMYPERKFWQYAERIKWRPEGVSLRRLGKFLEAAQDAAERISAEIRGMSFRFEAVVNKQQNFIYNFRDNVLTSSRLLYDLIREIKNILELKPSHWTEEKNTEDIHRAVEGKLEKIGEKLLKLKNGELEEVRTEILTLVDQQWENHLAEIHELEDEIFLKGLSSEDPSVLFIKEADTAFHHMRLDFTQKAADILIAKTAALSDN